MIKVIFIIFSFLWLSFTNQSVTAADGLQRLYQHVILGDRPTRYKVNQKSNNNSVVYEITAIGDHSASGLYVEDPQSLIIGYPNVEWSWRVDQIQKSADISVKRKEDFPASIQFVFGESSLFSRPKVLSYAWVADNKEIEKIISSPRIPNHFKTIILDNEKSEIGVFKYHKRNIIEDYKKAFGDYPNKELSAFGIFTDNDQTKEPVQAVYSIELKGNL